MGHSKGSPKRKVYSYEYIYKNGRKISNKQPNATSQIPRKIKTSKTQNKQKREIKIRAKINEIETKKTIQRINKTTNWFFEKIKQD
jgi:hypothetical protein